jgi:hypothetical protein
VKWVHYCTGLGTDNVALLDLATLFSEVQWLRYTGLDDDAKLCLATFQKRILSCQMHQVQTMECVLGASLDTDTIAEDTEELSGDESKDEFENEMLVDESKGESENEMLVDMAYENTGVSGSLHSFQLTTFYAHGCLQNF